LGLVTCVLMAASCTGPSRTAHGPGVARHLPTIPSSTGPPRCPASVTVRVALGTRGVAPIRGNTARVVARAMVGDVVRVTVHFSQRTVTAPTVTGDTVLRPLCVRRSGFGQSAYFSAEAPGVVTVSARTADCPPCAQFAMTAVIKVRRR
jgi:hypothetical protein